MDDVALPAVAHACDTMARYLGDNPDRPDVSSMTLDGGALGGPFLTHDEVTAGGTRLLDMSVTP